MFLGLLFVSPFLIHFKSIAEGVGFVRSHTPLWQLAILWGFPALLTILLYIQMRLRKNWRNTSDYFVVALLLTSWVLIFLPEVIFVKDIYIATHHRANTMFKLTYQAFVMSYITSGFIAVRFLQIAKNIFTKGLVILFFSVVFGSLLWYPHFAINSYYGELKTYKALAGDTWVPLKYPGIYDSINWLKRNAKGQPVILEAAGDSYTDSDLVSAYTGFPTVVGWFVHEWLWRGASAIPQERFDAVEQIYASTDIYYTQQLLQKFKVKYIIVGPLEMIKYPNINLDKINKVAKPVFNSQDTTIYEVNPIN
jgi:uncharacterized membrane protein